MPEVVYAILEALIQLGGSGNRFSIPDISGYDYSSVVAISPSMVRHGVIGRRWGLYWITERGRLVWALENARRTRAIANGTFRLRAYTATAYKARD